MTSQPTTSTPREQPILWEIDRRGELSIDLHYGQTEAWDSERRFIAVIAGTQSGKTSFGPLWLWREIQRRGPGDYLVVTPSFPLLQMKALPEFLRLFQETLKIGKYVASPIRHFRFSAAGARKAFGKDADPRTPTVVFFGHADDPQSLESATAKAVWCDEAGQKKFKLESWEAIRRRLSIHRGRALLTTTPYDLGWLKTIIFDPWRQGDQTIQVVNFASIYNPVFPREEYVEQYGLLPLWKWRMFYKGLFERPAGLIYDCFDAESVYHVVDPFAIPDDWPRFLGLDFGGVNMAGMFYAEDPQGILYAYREYRGGNLSMAEHAAALLEGEPTIPLCVGGAKSEDQWRREFRRAGLPVHGPDISEVEIGINRVYAVHKQKKLRVFKTLKAYLSEKGSYSRALDESGQPTKEIEDKSKFHLLDAERYIVGRIRRG